MRKGNNVQNVILIVLSVVVIFMSIGYALYTQQLTINGIVHVAPAKWEVKFDENVRNHNLEGTATVTSESISGTSASYEVSLAKPGDEYTLSTQVVNSGTIDAKLVKITLGGLTDAQKKFVSYVVTYDGTEYDATSGTLALTLDAGARKSVSVKVKYLLPDAAADLPSEAVNLSLTCTLDYQSNVA